MAFLLADALALTQDQIVAGVIETLIKESAVLRYLPFLPVEGSALRYNQERALATADFYGVGDTWTESVLTVQEVLTGLKILGGDADVDNFLQQTMHNPNDLQAIALQNKAKATAYAFSAAFFKGSVLANPNAFDGLNVFCGAIDTGGAFSDTIRAVSFGANGASLTLGQMDALKDAVKPGAPAVFFMSKRSRRLLSALRRASSNLLETGVDAFGRHAMFYDGIPIEVDENLTDVEVQGGSTDCSSIYAVQFGYGTGIMGLQNGGITVDPIGNLEVKDARRWRIKWYCGLAAFRVLAVARLAGVRP